MPGPARRLALAAIFVTVSACGVSTEAPPPATPGAHPTPSASPAPGEPTAAGPTTTTADAKPSSEKGWPLSPAPTEEEKKAQQEKEEKSFAVFFCEFLYFHCLGRTWQRVWEKKEETQNRSKKKLMMMISFE